MVFATVYRGVSERTHGVKAYERALKGVSRPNCLYTGHARPKKHDKYSGGSQLVSVTTDLNVARRFASPGGVVLEYEVSENLLIKSPDTFDQNEFLYIGTLKGGSVIEIVPR